MLYCEYNQLTTLGDLNLPNLYRIWCNNNNLIVIGTLNTPKLQYLYCHNNQLTTLINLNAPNLLLIYCHHNQLTTLDELKLITGLKTLSCSHNKLILHNISFLQFKNLKELYFNNPHNYNEINYIKYMLNQELN